MEQKQTCALCGETKELQLSHIVPKFINRHLKKTSMMKIRNMDGVVQDGEKHYLLCHDCEELFSKSERAFANQIFYPYLKEHKDTFDYSAEVFYFITSLSWRSLYLDICDFVKEGTIKIEVLNKMIQSEEIMKSFLLGKRADIGAIENHVFFFDRVESSSIPESGDINLVVHRTVQSYSAYQDDTIFTISNLCGIVLVTLYQKDKKEQWVNTEIKNCEGSISAPGQHITSKVGNEISFWCEQAVEMKKNLSAVDYNRMIKTLQDIGEDIKNYPIYQDIADDYNLKKN